ERRDDGNIYTKKSVAFLITFIALIVLRLWFKGKYIANLDQQTIGLLFYVVVSNRIFIPWRIACYNKV
ncbi:cobalamin biosynthesis protein CbiX, partial [Bacillus cereus]